MPAERNLELSRTLGERRRELAEGITARHYELQPELAVRYGAAGRAKCLQDAEFHLSYLADAVSVDLPADPALLAVEYVETGLRQLPAMAPDVPTEIGDDEPLAGLARGYLQALLRGERHVASRLVLDAVEAGTSVRDVYLHVFQRSQHEVGCLWQTNRLSVAQEHYCTAATQLVMSQLYPCIFASERNGQTLVATCVAGDLHEIGVRMVSDFFEMEAGTRSTWEPTRFYEDLVRINNEQANALRAALKDASLQTRQQTERDADLYDELSHLNNELATAQRELARKNAELARLNEQKNQFLGIAAHDLRNPLEVILTYSEFLLEDAAPVLGAEQIELVHTIRSSSEFMLRQVESAPGQGATFQVCLPRAGARRAA